MVLYFLTGFTARKASRDYLRRVRRQLEALGRPIPPRLDTLRHSSRSAIRYWTNGDVGGNDGSQRGRARRSRDAAARARAGSRRAFISSHLGNVEVFRALVDSQEAVKVAPLVFTNRSPNLNGLFSAVGPRALEGMIQIDSLGPGFRDQASGEAAIGRAHSIRRRPRLGAPCRALVAVPFLGQPAPFPEGPFILARLLACPGI